MKKPVLCDVDGVICGFMEYVLNFAKNSNCKSLVPEYDHIEGEIREYPFWFECNLEEEWKKEGFCESLPLLEGSQQFIESIRSLDFPIVFLTSPPKENKTWPYERRVWLEKHFRAKRTDVIFAVDKRYVDGVTLIDDHTRNAVDWKQYNKKESLLISRPWNRDFDSQIVLRPKNYQEIIDFLKETKNGIKR